MRTTSADTATALRRAATGLAARTRVERAGELSLNQVAVLGRLAVLGAITPGEVAAQLAMLPQSLTRVIASLEKAGHIVRTPHPTDGRGALLDLTPTGRRALRDEMAPRDRWLAGALAAHCTPAEQATLAAAAHLMLRIVERDPSPVPVEP